jgi:hypothetical protein
MRLSKRKARVISEAIETWEQGRVLSADEARRLGATLEIVPFDWRRLAKYSFWVAVACIAIAVFAALTDRTLLEWLRRLIDLSAFGRCLALSILAGVLYGVSLRRRATQPQRVYRNEAICFLAVLSTAGAVEALGEALSSGRSHFSMLFLMAAVLYGVIGLSFPSTQVWIFALLSVGSWVGFETGYVSGWGAYYLGLNYPFRFLILGVILTVGSHAFLAWPARAKFWKPTFVVGLLFVFMSLWIMSIFGNYGDIDSWQRASFGALLKWCVLFAGASALAIWYGVRFDDRISRGFGITFLFINLYTRFFEHFWDSLHKAVFFALLGLSFWLLGSRAETIWTLGGVGRRPKRAPVPSDEAGG